MGLTGEAEECQLWLASLSLWGRNPTSTLSSYAIYTELDSGRMPDFRCGRLNIHALKAIHDATWRTAVGTSDRSISR